MRPSLSLSLLAPLAAARVVQQPFQQVYQAEVQPYVPTIGIGLHLANSYAIVAVQYEDGTGQDLMKIEGDSDYVQLMATWATTDCNSVTEFTCEAEWMDAYDIGVLSTFLRQVKYAVEASLQQTVVNVMPAFPMVRVVDTEAIDGAFALAGLSWMRRGNQADDFLYVTTAAYAGLGLGLDEPSHSMDHCGEFIEEPLERVLFVSMDDASVSATLQEFRYPGQQFIAASSMSTDLGWWDLPSTIADMVEFWWQIDNEIIYEVVAAGHKVDRVVLYGSHAQEADFMRTLQASLARTWNPEALVVEAFQYSDLSEVLAARGAAQLAFRSSY